MMCLITCEASVVSVSSSLVFCGNSVQKMCTSAPYHTTMKTSIAQIYLDFSKYKSSILKCHFKCFSEQYIKPISEKYTKVD